MNGTIVINCDCKHDNQDLLYGKGRRVANYKGGESTSNKCSCTVCGKEHSYGGNVKAIAKPTKK